MKTIAILAPSSVPFTLGGAEKFWWGLHKGLTEYSDAYIELIKLPCKELSFKEIVNSYQSFAELDLAHFDMVISSKYPAWMVSHPQHVIYMQHPLRGLYDTYHFTGLPKTLVQIPGQICDLVDLIRKECPNRADLKLVFDMLSRLFRIKSLPSSLLSFPGPLIREVVHFFDRVALNPKEITAYFAISNTVRNRVDYFPKGVDVKILHHPSDLVDFTNLPGKYIFTASRLTNMKRLHLIVEAMRHVTVNIPLRIAGDGPELRRLQALAAGDSRIEFLGYVPDAQLVEYYKHALFVPFVPYDEDYGLITIEAMHSGKPVVTVSDAGGVCEFVVNGKTGYCTEPTPEALGAAMQKLASDTEHVQELGCNAHDLVSEITWNNTVTSVLSYAAKLKYRKAAGNRQKVLVATTFSAAYPISGGQRRVYHLCQALAKNYFVELLCIGGKNQRHIITTQVSPHFYEICLPWSEERAAEENILEEQTQANIGDIACMNTCEYDTRLLMSLVDYGEDAAFIIASHPYLYPALYKKLPNKPIVYDAHNVEFDMKSAVLKDCSDIDEILHKVKNVEKNCCVSSKIILACSEEDRQRFIELYSIKSDKIFIIQNGFDIHDVSFVNSTMRNALRKKIEYDAVFTAIFIGSLHRPNIDAVVYIKDMALHLPHMRFLIIGSVCDAPGVQDNIPENIYFLGVVSEKEKNILLSVANIALNPIESGSGSNLKLLEYVASGLETISTPFGLRGFTSDSRLLQGIRIVELDNFVSTLQEASANPLQEENRAIAAKYIAEQFSWDNIMKKLPEVVTQIVDTNLHDGEVCLPK